MPLSALAALSLIQAVPAAAQGIRGLVQHGQANKMAEGLVDPNYQIQEEYKRSLGNAETLAQSKYMPGYGLMQDQLSADNAASSADIMQGATSGAEALAAITNQNRNTQRTQRDIGVANAQNYQDRQGQLRQQLMMMGQQKDKQWDINVMQRFLRDSAAASALKNAGIQNTQQGIKGLAGAGATYFGNKLLQEQGGSGVGMGQMGMGQPQMNTQNYSPMIAPNTYTGQQLTPEQLMMLQYQMSQGGTTTYNQNFQ